MNRLRPIILAGALWVALLAPALAGAQELAVLTASSRTISVAKGSYVLIELAANPTTGYSWSTKGFSRAGVAQVLGSDYVPPTSHLLGAGGTCFYLLKALGTGTTTLTLAYARSFDSGGATTQRFVITVTP
jgi:inhibitor of cysteine peptidase